MSAGRKYAIIGTSILLLGGLTSVGGYALWGYDGPREPYTIIKGSESEIVVDADKTPAFVLRSEIVHRPHPFARMFGKVKEVRIDHGAKGYEKAYVWRRCVANDWNDDFSGFLQLHVELKQALNQSSD